jgi:hypothetical protein
MSEDIEDKESYYAAKITALSILFMLWCAYSWMNGLPEYDGFSGCVLSFSKGSTLTGMVVLAFVAILPQ